MLVVVSPAKRLDWNVESPMKPSVPEFHRDALVLSQIARQLGAEGLRKLMRISPALGEAFLISAIKAGGRRAARRAAKRSGPSCRAAL